MRIATRGPWQLDIGQRRARTAARAAAKQGVGDTVLSYRGPAATAHLTYGVTSRLIVNLYENGGLGAARGHEGPVRRPDLPGGGACCSSR